MKEGWLNKILGTLFAGFKDSREPHDNPEPNDFGLFVEESYDLMEELLEETAGEKLTCTD